MGFSPEMRPERAVVRGQGAPREADCCPKELAALVEHALLDDLVRPEQQWLGDRQPEHLRGFQIDHQLELVCLLDR